MNHKTVIGLALGFLIGLGCSLLAIPVPAPPVLVGALLVVAMTSGYILTDKYLAISRPQAQKSNCGGPSGEAS
ncbi:MAG: DUF1427 family protein [Pseudomonadota bacterium]